MLMKPPPCIWYITSRLIIVSCGLSREAQVAGHMLLFLSAGTSPECNTRSGILPDSCDREKPGWFGCKNITLFVPMEGITKPIVF